MAGAETGKHAFSKPGLPPMAPKHHAFRVVAADAKRNAFATRTIESNATFNASEKTLEAVALNQTGSSDCDVIAGGPFAEAAVAETLEPTVIQLRNGDNDIDSVDISSCADIREMEVCKQSYHKGIFGAAHQSATAASMLSASERLRSGCSAIRKRVLAILKGCPDALACHESNDAVVENDQIDMNKTGKKLSDKVKNWFKNVLKTSKSTVPGKKSLFGFWTKLFSKNVTSKSKDTYLHVCPVELHHPLQETESIKTSALDSIVNQDPSLKILESDKHEPQVEEVFERESNVITNRVDLSVPEHKQNDDSVVVSGDQTGTTIPQSECTQQKAESVSCFRILNTTAIEMPKELLVEIKRNYINRECRFNQSLILHITDTTKILALKHEPTQVQSYGVVSFLKNEDVALKIEDVKETIELVDNLFILRNTVPEIPNEMLLASQPFESNVPFSLLTGPTIHQITTDNVKLTVAAESNATFTATKIHPVSPENTHSLYFNNIITSAEQSNLPPTVAEMAFFPQHETSVESKTTKVVAKMFSPFSLIPLTEVDWDLQDQIRDGNIEKIANGSHHFQSEFPDKYTLGALLGQGNYGFVFKAVEIETRKEVAVKFITSAILEESDCCVNSNGILLPREVVIVESLTKHTNVIEFLDHFMEPDYTLMITNLHGANTSTPNTQTFLQGGTCLDLGQYIETYWEKGIRVEAVAAKIFTQLVSGVQFCHAKGVVHRDLKEANVVIDCQLNIQIIDLYLQFNVSGSASFTPTSYAGFFKFFIGTRYYASPEISGERIKPYRGPEADVWALGVILVFLLFGESEEDISDAIFEGTYDWSTSDRKFSKGKFLLISRPYSIINEYLMSLTD